MTAAERYAAFLDPRAALLPDGTISAEDRGALLAVFAPGSPAVGGGVDTAAERMAALLEPWAVVIPDGTIATGDRMALLGQYPESVVAGDPAPTCLFGATGRAKYGATVTCQ